MNNNVSLKFKSNIPKQNKVSNETIKNSIRDLNKIFAKFKKLRNDILKCNSIEELNKLENLAHISNDLGFLALNSIIIEDLTFKKRLEEVNSFWRETEITYFNKKIDLLNNKLNENYNKTNYELKEITGNTLFSIAAIFLGISLTSSFAQGIEIVGDNLIIFYFLTCLLIAVMVLGLAAIFIRKFDKKSVVITFIVLIVSLLWIFTFKHYEPFIIK